MRTNILVVAIFFIFILIGCSSEDDALLESFTIEDERIRERVIHQLTENNIKVKLEGISIKYDYRYRDKAQEVIFSEIRKRPSETSVAYVDSKYTSMLIDELKKNRILFTLRVANGKKSVILDSSNEEEWGPHKERIDKIYKDEIMKILKKIKDKNNKDKA